MKMHFIILLMAGLIGGMAGCGSAQPHVHGVETLRFQSVQPGEAVLLQSGDEKESCPVCGMHLPGFYKTNHALAFANGQTFQFCSIHCLADVMEHQLGEEQKGMISVIRVVDVASLKWIDAVNAHYVVGSKKPGTMSRVSKYAFQQPSDAEEFVRKFGGDIMDFSRAYERAKEDFYKARHH